MFKCECSLEKFKFVIEILTLFNNNPLQIAQDGYRKLAIVRC